ncbi:hypothetical protein JMJ35_001791 [Cladonia borealis]|uniref:Uncharacterized protein n=1 Tax=Cladonia borealis TaxID=184061 RepID=A0AA39V4J2_9LECA|nr:hypothetical protein JMJ35_001791 [Cladonia borealis]
MAPRKPRRSTTKGESRAPKVSAPHSTAEIPSVPSKSKIVPVELQQLLLNIFKNTFRENYNSKLSGLIQQTKQHLFSREFNKAFGSEDLREAYAVRWSPSRALAYTQIFYNLTPLTRRLVSDCGEGFGNPEHGPTDQPQDALANAQNAAKDAEDSRGKSNRIVCIGAGAGAEIVALGGYLSLLSNRPVSGTQEAISQDEGLDRTISPQRLEITAIDIADWGSVVDRLQSNVTAAPPLSQYASAEAKAANSALIGATAMVLNFVKQDVLSMAMDQMPAIFADALLVTLMFTLNELYTSSMSATTNLLLALTMLLPAGALLLVVDSPGSYSTVSVGKTSDGNGQSTKNYPMQWLLDHTLLESAAIGSSKNASAERQWEKLESQDSEWFRLPSELRYPIELEDMRYQMHLYRRL